MASATSSSSPPSIGSPTTPLFRSPLSVPLFALIIGINEYVSSEVKNLRGGVSDAKNFMKYLVEDLKVPRNQIHLLLDKQATRAAIIQEFKFLRDDNRIQKGDAIFIFYAGHGTQVEMKGAPPIELLVSHDFSTDTDQIRAITDRELARLIDDISKERGDNITVVLDCCHSASVTRNLLSQSHTSVRSIGDLLTENHYKRYEDATSTRGTHILAGASSTSLRSHMLIAACSSTELAKESNEQGLFSAAFLTLLRTRGPDELRYSDVLKYIDVIPSQNPQCRGDNSDRFIFNKKVLPSRRKFFPVEFKTDQARFILQAGTAHGVTKDDEFTVYPSTYLERDEDPLGRLTVSEAGSYTSIMKGAPTLLLGTPSVAVKTQTARRTDLRLHIQGKPRDDLRSLIATLISKPDMGNIAIVEKVDDAHMSLCGDKQEIQFRVVESGAPPDYRYVNSVQDPKEEQIVDILKASAKFFWHRHRQSTEMAAYVKLEFYRLDETKEDFTPAGKNLCQNNKIDFVVEEEAPYGIRCTNLSNSTQFYPSFYYFDSSDLSIGSYYIHSAPAGAHLVEPPLPKNGDLTIGFGSSVGADPFQFFLRPGQNVDFGHLKIFLYTQAVDQEDFRQPSPFDLEQTRATTGWTPKPKKPLGPIWGTITIPVIQRRSLHSS